MLIKPDNSHANDRLQIRGYYTGGVGDRLFPVVLPTACDKHFVDRCYLVCWPVRREAEQKLCPSEAKQHIGDRVSRLVPGNRVNSRERHLNTFLYVTPKLRRLFLIRRPLRVSQSRLSNVKPSVGCQFNSGVFGIVFHALLIG